MGDKARELDTAQALGAGRLCLEFADTLDWRESDAPVEHLNNYGDLIDWSLSIGLIDPATATDLHRTAKRQPILADQLLGWAIELREAIYRIFVNIARDGTPRPEDVQVLNDALPNAMTGPELTHADDTQWRLHWRGDHTGLDRMLWPIIRSAAALLTEEDLSRVGQCADDRGCAYLFFDTTRNRSRRWCDMNSCGNRAKARRHHRRRKQHETGEQTAPPGV